MTSTKSLLLACTALTAAIASSAAFAAPPQQPFAVAQVIAQAPPPPQTPAEKAAQEKKEREEKEKHRGPPAAKPAPPPAPPAAQQKPAAPPPPPAAQQKPAAPPPAAQPKPAAPPPPPAAQQKPAAPPPPPAAQQRPTAPQTPPPAAVHRPAPPQTPPAAQVKPVAPPPPPAAQVKPVAPPPPPAAQAKPAVPPPAPAAQAKPAVPPSAPAAQAKPTAPPAAPAAQAPSAAPAAQAKPATPPPAPAAAAAPPPPTKAQSASQFIQRKGEKPSSGMEALRKERHETQEGNRTIIQEGNRTIVREGDRRIIQHNEADRFAVGARDVKVEHKDSQTISIILRPDGIRIVSTTDRDGQLLRRVRRDRDGRDVVIIDNSFAGAQRGNYFVDLPPPRYGEPRDRYIVDAGRVNRDRIYGVLLAPPIERLDRRYTLEQVRYSYPLREYMPRVDLDINFASGSWQLSPAQVDQLGVIAQGINRAIAKNPREVFLIEGHTDAVGSAEDNLSLSDRRAEAVAVALTEAFQVPPENLATQGYGEEHLKVQTDGPSRENRRVAVRRITPLIDPAAGR